MRAVLRAQLRRSRRAARWSGAHVSTGFCADSKPQPAPQQRTGGASPSSHCSHVSQSSHMPTPGAGVASGASTRGPAGATSPAAAATSGAAPRCFFGRGGLRGAASAHARTPRQREIRACARSGGDATLGALSRPRGRHRRTPRPAAPRRTAAAALPPRAAASAARSARCGLRVSQRPDGAAAEGLVRSTRPSSSPAQACALCERGH